MSALLQVLTSLCAAAPAGLNAYLALLLVGLGARAHWIALTPPFDFIQSAPALIALVILLTFEIFADKRPALDSANDAAGTVLRPVAGAIIFAATNSVLTSSNLVLSLLLGAAAAGLLHLYKKTTRPVWSVYTSGLANPIVSVLEDMLAGVVVVLAMLAPVAALVLLLLATVPSYLVLMRMRRAISGRLSTPK